MKIKNLPNTLEKVDLWNYFIAYKIINENKKVFKFKFVFAYLILVVGIFFGGYFVLKKNNFLISNNENGLIATNKIEEYYYNQYDYEIKDLDYYYEISLNL